MRTRTRHNGPQVSLWLNVKQHFSRDQTTFEKCRFKKMIKVSEEMTNALCHTYFPVTAHLYTVPICNGKKEI